MNEDERLAKLREAYETALLKPAQARLDQANEEYALTPKLNDSVTDMAFDANGRPNPKDAVRIQKMEDERGNVIYLSYPIGQPTRTSLEDLRALSLRILDQRTAFEQLALHYLKLIKSHSKITCKIELLEKDLQN